MPRHDEQYDAAEEEWDEEDAELPQDEDDDETPTVPCPHCHQPVPDFADRCPYCGDWIVQSAGPPGRRPWFVALVILALLIVLAWVFR
jgi:hypothetical protein